MNIVIKRILLVIPIALLAIGLALDARRASAIGTTVDDGEARLILGGGPASCPGSSYTSTNVTCGTSSVACGSLGRTVACAKGGSWSSIISTGSGTDTLQNSATNMPACMVCGIRQSQCGNASQVTGTIVAACSTGS
jgi:hypothetical protein